MRNVSEIFGKRLKAVEETTAFNGYPGSDNIELYPAGSVTGEIYSYLPQENGYFQVKKEGKPFQYVQDSESVEIVSKDAKDESSIFGNIFSGAGTAIRNGTTWIKKNTGYVAEGFEDSVSILDTQADKYIRYGLIGGGLILAIQIIKLLRD